MILYHLTDPNKLEAILREGLRAPLNTGTANQYDGMPACVWLTSVPNLTPTRADQINLLESGHVCFDSYMPAATCCVRVKISSHDRKLKHWKTWARKHLGIERQSLTPLRWWVYFGDIASQRIEFFKQLPPARHNIDFDEAEVNLSGLSFEEIFTEEAWTIEA